VEVEGEGVVCHEGSRSCFTKELAVHAFPPSKTGVQHVRSERSESKGVPEER
jgi:hypothetical protein